MQCPKCRRESLLETECNFCGIVFDKYRQQTETEDLNATTPEDSDSPRSSSGLIWGVIAGAVGLAVIGYIFVSHPSKTNVQQGGDHMATLTTAPAAAATEARAGNGDSIKRKLETSVPPKNRIESARNATVYVKTAWGVYGSGFFIDDQCHVVTNRHVVKVEQEELDRVRQIRDDLSAAIERDKAIIERIRERPDIMGDANVRQALHVKEKKVEAASAQLDTFSTMIERAGMNAPSDVSVILVDGTDLSVQDIKLSDNYDLALLTAWCSDSPYIAKGSLRSLAQGRRVYTIGNPQGLKFSVTSGIFSGWQDINNVKVLQTDAPINPGNSGGPLLAEDGRVVGVNTAVLRSSQNIGFALPIDDVFNEFSEYFKK